MLLCCYSAAVALQRHYIQQRTNLAHDDSPLSDLFASRLPLPPMADPDARLKAVAACHAELSGERLNWKGSYEHTAAAFFRSARLHPA